MNDITPLAHGLFLSDTDQNALGPFRSLHPAGSRMHMVNILVALGFTALFVVPVLAFLIASFVWPDKNFHALAIALGGFALLPAAGVAYLVHMLWWRLCLFENGFVIAAWRQRVVLWTDIDAFFQVQVVVAGMNADRWLRFVLVNGDRLAIDSSYGDFLAFHDAVAHHATAVVVDRANAALARGETVSFGTLRFTPDGLDKEVPDVLFVTTARERIAWSEVHGVTVEWREVGTGIGDVVVVYQKSAKSPSGKADWLVTPAGSFPNMNAFLHLVAQYANVGNST